MRPVVIMPSKKQGVIKSSKAECKKRQGLFLRLKTGCRNVGRHTVCGCKIITPEVGSLYHVLQDHATTSLFVQPCIWTDRHAQLLGCHFVKLPPQNVPTPTPSSSPRRSPGSKTPQIVVEIGKCLDVMMSSTNHHRRESEALNSILDAFYQLRFLETSSELTVFFGERYYHRAVCCPGMWKTTPPVASFDTITASNSESNLSEDSSGNLTTAKILSVTKPSAPVLAYVSREHLDHMRKNHARIAAHPRGVLNGPVYRLQQLRSRRLIPKNPDEDQYILATMLAMAQQHAYDGHMVLKFSYKPKDVRVCVISPSKRDASLIVYTAVIPAAFLDKFHQPDKAPEGDAGIKIEYQRVPVWPVLGFKERLGQALGKDLVGEVNLDNMETFEYDWFEDALVTTQGGNDKLNRQVEKDITNLTQKSPRSDRPNPAKSPTGAPERQKRKAFSEVSNKSFSEDRTAPEYPSELLGKRRCLEEGRVGVVR
ncbi:hypothetical protein F4819DRAFT_473928 [Hypoxylon fuscum]|nr:hypothetical protein F4819DRAFT_473928 [Hypoxylon fuscum]